MVKIEFVKFIKFVKFSKSIIRKSKIVNSFVNLKSKIVN